MSPGPAFRVGLTGGIASGKSTVAAMLAELGAFVVDADLLSRELMQPGGAVYQAVVQRFGRSILGPGECIDRQALGRIVFADSAEREALNAILHPAIRAEAQRRMDAAAPQAPFAVFDAALLVETGAWRGFDRLIVTRCSPATQIRRLIERDGLTAEEARARVEAQAALEDKLAVADYVIDTDGDLERTRRQTRAVFTKLSRQAN